MGEKVELSGTLKMVNPGEYKFAPENYIMSGTIEGKPTDQGLFFENSVTFLPNKSWWQEFRDWLWSFWPFKSFII